jgi:hypothetical protein
MICRKHRAHAHNSAPSLSNDDECSQEMMGGSGPNAGHSGNCRADPPLVWVAESSEEIESEDPSTVLSSRCVARQISDWKNRLKRTSIADWQKGTEMTAYHRFHTPLTSASFHHAIQWRVLCTLRYDHTKPFNSAAPFQHDHVHVPAPFEIQSVESTIRSK